MDLDSEGGELWFQLPSMHMRKLLTRTMIVGDRVCPGRYLGDNSVFVFLSGITATMNIAKERDGNGNEIIPNPSYNGGLAG